MARIKNILPTQLSSTTTTQDSLITSSGTPRAPTNTVVFPGSSVKNLKGEVPDETLGYSALGQKPSRLN